MDNVGNIDLRLGDCLELMRDIPDGSVDAVITDPPYPSEFNHLYGAMAKEAKRVLKRGGLLFTLTGHHSFAQILRDMTEHLDFYWIGGMPNTLGSVARYHPRQMMMGWKPCIWLSNGKPKPHDYVFDFFKVSRIDRVNHEWEQSVDWFEYYVEKLTLQGDVILDPFMGSGTTGVACARLNRDFIGIEKDPIHFSKAKERITAERPYMLFVERRIAEAQLQLALPMDAVSVGGKNVNLNESA